MQPAWYFCCVNVNAAVLHMTINFTLTLELDALAICVQETRNLSTGKRQM